MASFLLHEAFQPDNYRKRHERPEMIYSTPWAQAVLFSTQNQIDRLVNYRGAIDITLDIIAYGPHTAQRVVSRLRNLNPEFSHHLGNLDIKTLDDARVLVGPLEGLKEQTDRKIAALYIQLWETQRGITQQDLHVHCQNR